MRCLGSKTSLLMNMYEFLPKLEYMLNLHPFALQVCQSDFLDGVIDHIKHLQNQMKVDFCPIVFSPLDENVFS